MLSLTGAQRNSERLPHIRAFPYLFLAPQGVTPVSKVDYQPVATTTLAAKSATAAKSAASAATPMGLAAAIGAAALMVLLL